MSNLPMPYERGDIARTDPRQDRRIAKLRHEGQMAREQLKAIGSIERTRVDEASSIARQAMMKVALMTQSEVSLCGLVPLSVSRVSGIADIGCLTLAEIVSEAGRRMQ